jgi:hypothetical protein
MKNDKGQPVCCVCHRYRVAHEHVVCRSCNEREWHGMLSDEEKARLRQELQYRRDNP